MPRPIFDIEQYELRGVKPDVFTREQNKDLNRALARAHGQIDWTAQLLGYNGPNYWGKSGFKADGTFIWNGLPETMVEKRQLQATTYGVFAKDKGYEYWPAPFNRSEILASGDHSFHMFEKDGQTLAAPYGLGEEATLSYDPTIFVGGAYIFDGEIEFYNPNDTVGLLKTETFSENDLLWTRLYVFDLLVDDVGIRRKNSEADFFFFKVRPWKDISDWNVRSIASQFIGAWGNKGASISLDAQFDALHLHGFSETNHLESLLDTKRTYSILELLDSIGAKPTPWTAFHNLNFGFSINGSDLFYPVPQDDFERVDFFEFSDCDIDVTVTQLIEEDEPEIIDCCEVDNEVYTRLAGGYSGPIIVNNEEYDIFNMIQPEYCVNAIDGGSTLTGHPVPNDLYCGGIEGDIDEDRPKGIGAFVFDVTPKTDCALDRLCIEWKFNSELDNGSYDDKYDWPSNEPDPTANCCLADNEETPPPYLGPNVADSFEFDGTLVDGDPVACEQALVGGDYPVTYDCNPDDLDTHMPSDNMPKMGPWITWDEGEYDKTPYPNENIGTQSTCDFPGDWISFDDGIYEEPRQPQCDLDVNNPIDGDEIWTYAYFPEYEDCECSSEICEIDNFPYINMTAYLGEDIVDGGESLIDCCVIDDGIIGYGPFEAAWNVGPDLTNCGPDSGINPYYCCEIDNEEYVWKEAPYYGPNVVNGCKMDRRLGGIRFEERPILIDEEDIILEDCDYLPEKDNGILNIDTWDINAVDPACCPSTCVINNGDFSQLDLLEETVHDNCSLLHWDQYETLCPDQGDIEIPDIPEPDGETFLYDNGEFNVDSWSLTDQDPACDPYYCQLNNGKFPSALSDLEFLETDFVLMGEGNTFFSIVDEPTVSSYGYATPMPPFVPVETTREPYLWDNGVIKEASWNAFAKDPQAYPYYASLNSAIYPKSAETFDFTVDGCTMEIKDEIIDCPGPEIPELADAITELVRVPVFTTFIVDCDSCWDDCATCEPAEVCPADDVFVKLGLFEEPQYKMHPGLENAYTPLRLWKAPTLNVTDTVRNHDTDKWNYLVADDNRGTNPENDYRSFVRLPLEYARGGKEWSKAESVCENMLYWSKTSDSVRADDVGESDAKQLIYENCVDKDPADNSIIYFEDYIHSNFSIDESESGRQEGFTDAGIAYEPTSKGAFTAFSAVEYDELKFRKPTNDGEWRGNYYRFTSKRDAKLSGHISQDLTNSVLEAISYNELPTHDMSEVKHLKSYFPDNDDKVTMKNYVVSYAYFAADFSAGDEPVFDPGQDYCHRSPVRTCSTVDRNGECIPTNSRNKTNYLLHPVA